MRHLRDEQTDEDEDDIPLHHKKPFGAGLKRKKVEFVRAVEDDKGIAAGPKPASRIQVGDLYASIVLNDGRLKSASAPATTSATPDRATSPAAEPKTCAICALPITTSVKEHEASLAHQVNMPHSHPPSALDRSRMGLKALESYGWDPDARVGLGREGEGARFPIKTKAKDDNLGIGATVPDKPKVAREPPPRKLTAKETQAVAANEKKRAERLQAEMYGRVDIDRYLHGPMED